MLCASICWIWGARSQAHTILNGSDVDFIEAAKDEAATRELLEGVSGRRESWSSAPTLVIQSSILDYRSGDLSSGFVALKDSLSSDEINQLRIDLTAALSELTAGTFKAFRQTVIEFVRPGSRVRMLRPGDIVVGRFRGVRAKTGNLGYGARSTSRNGSIVQAVVVLDESFDSSDRRSVGRTHELGHALGFNHVSFRPSIMNPRAGTTLLTDFDRVAIRDAFVEPPSFR